MMVRNKISYFIILVLCFSLITTLKAMAMQPAVEEIEKKPVYPIYPIEDSEIKVNEEKIKIKIQDDGNQPAFIEHKFTLENPTDEQTDLNLIYAMPNYDTKQNPFASFKIKEDHQELNFKHHELFLPFYDTADYYIDGDQLNYNQVLHVMNYEGRGIEESDLDKTVKLYKIPSTNLRNNLIINHGKDARIIGCNMGDESDSNQLILYRYTSYNDVYFFDFNNSLTVTLDNELIKPMTTLSAKDALKVVIRKSKDDINDYTLESYYQFIVEHWYLDKGLNTFNTEQSYSVKEYTLSFAPGEVKEIQVLYTVQPSFRVFSSQHDHYYTYSIPMNKDHWNDYGDISFEIELNGHYKYMTESNFDVVKSNGNIYMSDIKDKSVTNFTFSTYTSDEIPSPSSFNSLIAWFLGGVLLGLLTIILTVTLFIRHLYKQNQRAKQRHF